MESKPDNTSRLLDAHGFLDRVIHQLQTLQSPHKDTLLSVLQYLSDHIRLTRSEIGALRQGGNDEQLFGNTADELEEIVTETARAANEIAKNLDQLDNLSIEAYVETLRLEQSGELSATQAKSVLAEILAHGGEPVAIAAAKGFERLASGALSEVVGQLIEEHPDEWSRYRGGDEKLAQFFIGQVMKLTKGQANGKEVIAELQARR